MPQWPAFHISAPLALAVVATLGYLVGRWRKRADEPALRSRRELRRARSVAREMERIARMIRKGLARHHASLVRFKHRVDQLAAEQQDAAWRELCREANEVLTPTLRLASQIDAAYDQIRDQSISLADVREGRTDPLTGLVNRRGLEETLAAQFALAERYEDCFSVLLVELQPLESPAEGQYRKRHDRLLRRAAAVLDESMRETDIGGRFGDDDFVFLILLPRTPLEGASAMAERIRARLREECGCAAAMGMAAAVDGDTPATLLGRAEAALARSRATGGEQVFAHTGQATEALSAAEW